MFKKSANIEQLESLAEILPAPVYWMDTNSVVLGANNLLLKAIGASSLDEIIGKTPYDFYPEKLAEHIVKFNEEVITKGIPLSQEETIKDLQTGKLRYYTASKSPLRNGEGKIIGIVGSSIEITAEKEAEALKLEAIKKNNVLKYLELLAPLFPISVYWLDLNSTILGANEHTLSGTGIPSFNDYLGKTLYEIYPKEIAEHIDKHNKEVIRTGQILSQEEPIKDISTGKVRYYDSFKAPLRDENGKIICILGISIETTAEKEREQLTLENERLKFENQAQQAVTQEQEKFRKIADQVAHDVRSPLASLLMIVKACQALPERERIALREAATTIGDMANNLLSNYQNKKVTQEHVLKTEEREPVLVSPILLQILTDKRYQYQTITTIKFGHHFSQPGSFAWINIQPTAFKRMLSNIINNSVNALGQKNGKITLYLDADEEEVRLTIEDNGKGMKPEVAQKILNQTEVTDGKANGHGIGLTQARETLENNEGEWIIDSRIDHGTQFILIFPRISALDWIAETMQLNDDDIVVILDDDSSIHKAWDSRFELIVTKFPYLNIKHFEQAQDTINFINSLAPDKKQKVFLLADYELLKQDFNGLEVIKKTEISRSILVTSHYANKTVQQAAARTGAKILPKQLASDIPINITQTTLSDIIPIQSKNNEPREVDVVFVDDDQRLLDSFTFFAFNKEVDTYHDPQHFLNNLHQYPKHTKIMLDQHFSNFAQKGLEIAVHLHSLGFTQLYLLSGDNFSGREIPDYLTTIMKTDLDKVEAILNESLSARAVLSKQEI